MSTPGIFLANPKITAGVAIGLILFFAFGFSLEALVMGAIIIFVILKILKTP